MRISDWSSDVCSSDLRGAAFEIADIRALVGDDQRAFELAGILGVDAEIGGKLHRATHALGHVDERSEEHTSTPVTNAHLVCRLLLEKKKTETLYLLNHFLI